MNWKRFFLVCLVLTAGLGLTFQSLDAKSRHSSSGYKNFGASTILKKTSWGVEFQPNIEDKLIDAGFFPGGRTTTTTLYIPDPENDYDDVPVKGWVKSYVNGTTILTLYIVNEGNPFVLFCTIEFLNNAEKLMLISEFKTMGFQGSGSSFYFYPSMFSIEIEGMKMTLSYSYV